MNRMSVKDEIVSKARAALAGHFGVLSMGEKLAVAMALNRPDWLKEQGYTIAEACYRLHGAWLDAIPDAARELSEEAGRQADEAAYVAVSTKAADLLGGESHSIDLYAEYVTYGYAPGYRDARLHFDVTRHGQKNPVRVVLCLNGVDGLKVSSDIVHIHKAAWRDGDTPIDVVEGEACPTWAAD